MSEVNERYLKNFQISEHHYLLEMCEMGISRETVMRIAFLIVNECGHASAIYLVHALEKCDLKEITMRLIRIFYQVVSLSVLSVLLLIIIIMYNLSTIARTALVDAVNDKCTNCCRKSRPNSYVDCGI